MPKILAFFHTALVHSETFDALRDRIAPGVAMHHNIRTNWLVRAREGIGPDLPGAVLAGTGDARGSGPVVIANPDACGHISMRKRWRSQ